ncbi:MAG: hypothetical protein K0U98_19260 [Deltaproteobacteria bacterium]|nr:hypothetical protein [Deltaproteobacteria bacterium]
MSTTGSKLMKFALILLLLTSLVLAGLWQWRVHQEEKRVAEAVAEAQELLEAAQVDLAKAQESSAAQEAVVVTQAFAAGIYPQVVTGRRDDLDLAVRELVHLDDIVFVHLLGLEGEVVATSDQKLAETGEIGPRVQWALEVEELTHQPGATAGTVEVAVPIEAAGSQIGVVLVGYDVQMEK